MPLMKCTKNGESGWKFGESGKCYVGENAKEKALEQGRAIKSQQSKGLVNKVFDIIDDQQDN